MLLGLCLGLGLDRGWRTEEDGDEGLDWGIYRVMCWWEMGLVGLLK